MFLYIVLFNTCIIDIIVLYFFEFFDYVPGTTLFKLTLFVVSFFFFKYFCLTICLICFVLCFLMMKK